MIQVFFGVPESYGNSPGSICALLGFRGKREERLGASQGLVRIGLGGGAAPPPSFSSLSPFLDSYYLEGGESYSKSRSRREGKGKEKRGKEGVLPLP